MRRIKKTTYQRPALAIAVWMAMAFGPLDVFACGLFPHVDKSSHATKLQEVRKLEESVVMLRPVDMSWKAYRPDPKEPFGFSQQIQLWSWEMDDREEAQSTREESGDVSELFFPAVDRNLQQPKHRKDPVLASVVMIMGLLSPLAHHFDTYRGIGEPNNWSNGKLKWLHD